MKVNIFFSRNMGLLRQGVAKMTLKRTYHSMQLDRSAVLLFPFKLLYFLQLIMENNLNFLD